MNRVMAFIPAYNCERQIGRTLMQFDEVVTAIVSDVIVVDNCSTDGTAAAAVEGLLKLRGVHGRLLQNDANYGLGGSHKVAFDYALDHGFDYCLVLHGDDQGCIRDILPQMSSGRAVGADCLLGARFMSGSQLSGYSRVRTMGNLVFNLLYSVAAGRRLFDLGSGLNLYSTSVLTDRFYRRLADDLTFNYELILASCARKWRIEFFPIGWRESDQISNVKLFRQAWKTARIASSYVWDRQSFLAADRSKRGASPYSWKMLFDSAALARETANQMLP